MNLNLLKMNANEANPQQCYECTLKQKYVPGSNLKCLKHTFQQKQKQILNQQQSSCIHEQIMNNLENISLLLPEYITQISYETIQQKHSYITEILNEIDHIGSCLKQILSHKEEVQTSLGHFLQEQRLETSNCLGNVPSLYPINNKQYEPKIFQLQRETIYQYIQEWVVYFSQKLSLTNTRKTFLKEYKFLPFQDDSEMKTFKDQINSIFQNFITKAQQKNKLLNQAINKLALYVDQDDRKSKNKSNSKRSNSFYDTTASKSKSKLQNLLTPIMRSVRMIDLQQTKTTGQNTKTKTKQNLLDSSKIHTSSFTIQNVSGIFQTKQTSCQKHQDNLFLLLCQAQCIEDLLSKNDDESLLL